MSFAKSHDAAVWSYANRLRALGYRVATEVGVDGGRIDIVRVGVHDFDWLELFEVKLHHPETGIPQLARYAGVVADNPLLTIVTLPECVTDGLRARAAAAGVNVVASELLTEEFRFVAPVDDDLGRWPYLRYFGHQNDRMRAA